MSFIEDISDELETKERAMMLKLVTDCPIHFDASTSYDIMNMMHTSLFEWKRCHNIYISNACLLAFATTRLTRTTLKHFTQMLDGNRFYIRARWDEKKQDVVFELRAMFPPTKKHEICAVHEFSDYISDELNLVRQACRVEYRKIWKDARERVAIHKAKQTTITKGDD